MAHKVVKAMGSSLPPPFRVAWLAADVPSSPFFVLSFFRSLILSFFPSFLPSFVLSCLLGVDKRRESMHARGHKFLSLDSQPHLASADRAVRLKLRVFSLLATLPVGAGGLHSHRCLRGAGRMQSYRCLRGAAPPQRVSALVSVSDQDRRRPSQPQSARQCASTR